MISMLNAGKDLIKGVQKNERSGRLTQCARPGTSPLQSNNNNNNTDDNHTNISIKFAVVDLEGGVKLKTISKANVDPASKIKLVHDAVKMELRSYNENAKIVKTETLVNGDTKYDIWMDIDCRHPNTYIWKLVRRIHVHCGMFILVKHKNIYDIDVTYQSVDNEELTSLFNHSTKESERSMNICPKRVGEIELSPIHKKTVPKNFPEVDNLRQYMLAPQRRLLAKSLLSQNTGKRIRSSSSTDDKISCTLDSKFEFLPLSLTNTTKGNSNTDDSSVKESGKRARVGTSVDKPGVDDNSVGSRYACRPKRTRKMPRRYI